MVKESNSLGEQKVITTMSKVKRHSANLNTDVFTKLGVYIAKWGNTKEAIVNQAVEDYVYGREQFLKLYAPHLTLENRTNKAFFIYDDELEKTAVVRAKWNNDLSDGKRRELLTLNCENCDSESCIHVRYSLALPDVLQLQKQGKLA